MKVILHIDGLPVTLENVVRKTDGVVFTFAGKSYAFRSRRLPGGSQLLEQEIAPGIWQRMNVTSWQDSKGARRMQLGGLEAKITETAANTVHADAQTALSPPAPMPGLVRQILVTAGDRVIQGQTLAVMEAMKLQITLTAGGNATVDKVLVQVGEMIAEGTELVRLTPQGEKK